MNGLNLTPEDCEAFGAISVEEIREIASFPQETYRIRVDDWEPVEVGYPEFAVLTARMHWVGLNPGETWDGIALYRLPGGTLPVRLHIQRLE